MADTPRCGARRKQTGPSGEQLTCNQPAGWGTDHPGFGQCKRHGGSTPNGVTAAARQRVASLTEGVRRQISPGFYGLGGPEVQVNPVEVLAEELARCKAVVAWIEGMVAQWGYDPESDQTGGSSYGRLPELMQTGLPPLLTVVHGEKSSAVTDSEYRAWLRQLGEERDRLRITAKMCLDYGLDERMVRLYEGGGLIIVQAIGLVLGWMGLTGRQGELDTLVPRALQELATSTATA